jgi:hypothetical protein
VIIREKTFCEICSNKIQIYMIWIIFQCLKKNALSSFEIIFTHK